MNRILVLASANAPVVEAPDAAKVNYEAFYRSLMRHEPNKTSRSRIKRLRGLRRPQYRLRIGAVRVFYDISGATVEILAIVTKSEAEAWLGKFRSPT